MTLPSWLSIVGLVAGLVGTAGLGGMFKTWLDHLRGKRKQTDDVAMALVAKLEERVDRLENGNDKLQDELKLERARCDAELQVHRHRINNQRMMIYSLLHLFEIPAARRRESLERIRGELASMEQAEAVEKGIVAAAPLSSPEPIA